MGNVVQLGQEFAAVQLRWDTWSDVCETVGVGRLEDGLPQGCYLDELGVPHVGDPPVGIENPRLGLCIPTIHGVDIAVEGDWLLVGQDGELIRARAIGNPRAPEAS